MPSPLHGIAHGLRGTECLYASFLLLHVLSTDPLIARRIVETGGLTPIIKALANKETSPLALAIFKETVVYAEPSAEVVHAVEIIASGVTNKTCERTSQSIEILDCCSLNSACWVAIVDKALPNLIDLLLVDAHEFNGAKQILKILHIIQRVSALKSHAEAVVSVHELDAYPCIHTYRFAPFDSLSPERVEVHPSISVQTKVSFLVGKDTCKHQNN